jgi:uncharacterized protein
MQQMSALIKPVSGACNLRCKYCFYRDEMGHRQTVFGRMTEDTLERVLKNLMSAGAQSTVVGFQGGEPLLAGLAFFEKAVALGDKYRMPGSMVLYTVQTNGTLIDEKWAAFFAEHGVLVGLSLDGIKAVHERWRGKNTFDRVTEAARLLDTYRVPYNIVSVITEPFAGNIEEIYRSYARHGYRYLQFIPCLDPLGEKAGVHKYSLQCATYGTFLKKLFDLWWADLERGREVYIRTFNDWIGILKGRRPDCCTERILHDENVVEADGAFFPATLCA